MLGTPESERLKVTALNLFHPTASPLFETVGFFIISTQPPEGGGVGAAVQSRHNDAKVGTGTMAPDGGGGPCVVFFMQW